MSAHFLSFPDFNIYSSPLLILSVQGLIFAILLFRRYLQKKVPSDVLLALILAITCYHRTTYTIGFMDWYDTYENTKINYYLVDLSMILAPLIYFYVRAITSATFRFKKKYYIHFIPWLCFFVVRLVILIYDASIPGFGEVQNGFLVVNFQWKYIDPLVGLFGLLQMLIYLVVTFQILFVYRARLQDFFSNTYKVELNWLRNFLYIYSFLFLFYSVQAIVNAAIVDLSWTQEWWYHFFSAVLIIYVGVKGYFTATDNLRGLGLEYGNFNFSKVKDLAAVRGRDSIEREGLSEKLKAKKIVVGAYMKNEKPHLNPDITLISLAKELKMSREELSEVINKGFSVKFNDFINGYRIEAVKQMFYENKHAELSLTGIAYECGFNSKATFNRVFRKMMNASPSQFISNLK